MSWFKANWFSGLILVLVFAGLFWYYHYNETFTQPPQSIHIWRQTNSLSMTQMYYQYHIPFFQPEIHNQIGDDGLSGKTAGEFPVIYYTMAQVWKVFGKSERSYRFFQFLLLCTGVFLLFRMLTPLTGNSVKAGFISMLVMTSPIIIFYGPNFLPDTPSLAFTFMAWFFLWLFTQKKKYWQLWVSSIFFFLAISIKLTAATSFIAIGSWILLENLFYPEEKRFFRFRFRELLPFIISSVLILSWYLYVNYYTDFHKGYFSYLGIWPIWKINESQFRHIIDVLNKIFFKEFFWPPLQFITLGIFLFLLIRIRKLTPFLRFMLIIMPVSMIAILALWFQVLDGHDYYMITQVQVLVIIWIIFFIYLKDKKFWRNPLVSVLLIGAFGFLAQNGRDLHLLRYGGWMNEAYKVHMEAFTTIGPWFKEWNIQPDDKVISIPDNSINASLYYMNRRGYTDFASDFTKEETFIKRIGQGAKYLVVNDSTILNRPGISRFTTHFIGQYRNVKVFDLKPFMNSN